MQTTSLKLIILQLAVTSTCRKNLSLSKRCSCTCRQCCSSKLRSRTAITGCHFSVCRCFQSSVGAAGRKWEKRSWIHGSFSSFSIIVLRIGFGGWMTWMNECINKMMWRSNPINWPTFSTTWKVQDKSCLTLSMNYRKCNNWHNCFIWYLQISHWIIIIVTS